MQSCTPRCFALCFGVLVYHTLYNTALHTLYYTVLHCMYYAVLHCTTYTVQHCTALYNTVLLCTSCEFWLFVGETLVAGSCLSISISRKEIKMRRHTHFLVMSEKFWGTQPSTKESIDLVWDASFSKKRFTFQKTRNIPLSLPMFVIKWCNLRRNSYIILSILLN